MAHLYINPDTDSIYVDVTAGDGAPVRTAEAADGVYLHLDEAGAVVAIEAMDVSRRANPHVEGLDMGHVHVNTAGDSVYVDLSAGTRPSLRSAAVAGNLHLHVDATGTLTAIEVTDLTGRGGLRVDDLDATPDKPRPSIFDQIERAVSRRRSSVEPTTLQVRQTRSGSPAGG